MFKKTQSYKPKSQKGKNSFEINRVVIESYYGSNRINESKIIKINNNVYNIKNIDNNMSRSNLNENIINNSKNELKSETSPKISYSLCNQNNFNIISHIKRFNTPLLIKNYSFNFIIKKDEPMNNNNTDKIDSKSEKENNKIYLIKSFDIFICGNQNLKSKNIINLKNSKKLEEEKNEEKNDKEIEKNNLSTLLENMNKRWKEAQREYKMRISYTNNSEILKVNLNEYKEDLISQINFEKTNSKSYENSYIIIKQNLKSKENKFIYEIIDPESQKDFEEAFNKLSQNDNKENNSSFINNSNCKDIHSNNGKKKSKFNNQNIIQNKKINDINSSTNSFYPLFIFQYSELKDIINKIEQDLKINKEKKSNEYILENNISLNIKGIIAKDIQKQTPKKEEEKINKTKQLLPTKVDEYKLIHKYENFKKNKVIEIKIIKNKNNEKEKTKDSKDKKTKDFGQSTPISLLKDKYFIYAVSKWSKYSTINSEINIYFKYCYKSGHPKFDSNILNINNFYLRIEKIKIEGNPKKSRNNSNSMSFKKTISTNKYTYKTNNEKNTIQKEKSSNFLHDNLNNNDTSVNKKKSKSKQKLEKKKNK